MCIDRFQKRYAFINYRNDFFVTVLGVTILIAAVLIKLKFLGAVLGEKFKRKVVNLVLLYILYSNALYNLKE